MRVVSLIEADFILKLSFEILNNEDWLESRLSRLVCQEALPRNTIIVALETSAVAARSKLLLFRRRSPSLVHWLKHWLLLAVRVCLIRAASELNNKRRVLLNCGFLHF